MEIRIPISRVHALRLIVAAASALIRGAATLKFTAEEVNGKARPVILSRDELADLQQGYMEAMANTALLRDSIEGALGQCPPELVNDPVVVALRDSLNAIDKRVLH